MKASPVFLLSIYFFKSGKLILDADLRKRLGEQLYEDFKEEYNLANVTKKRAEFYKSVVANTMNL